MEETEGLLADLDFPVSLVCDVRFCNHQATQSFRTACGHESFVYCGFHAARLMSRLLEARARGGVQWCPVDRREAQVEVMHL